MDNVNGFYGNAQSGSHHLGKGGFVPLTMAVRAGENGDAAGGVHANFTALKQTSPGTQRASNVGRGDATGLDVAGVSDAAQFAFGLAAGLIGSSRAKIYDDKMARIGAANAVLGSRTCSPQELQAVGLGVSRDGATRSLLQVLAFADTEWAQIDQLAPEMAAFDDETKAQVWRDALYAQYLHREKADADTLRRNELQRIPAELDFTNLPGLSNELASKLQRRRPSNLAEAERIEGMTPAALLLVLAHCRKANAARAVGQ